MLDAPLSATCIERRWCRKKGKMPRPQLSHDLPADHTCQLHESQLPPQLPFLWNGAL